jgi:MFS family permease
MLNQQQRLQNQKLLIASNIAIIPLLTSFGGADASILQLYATSILALKENEIGIVIGLPALVIPLQLLGIYLVKRWGSKKTLIVGFALLFCLLPLMLIIPTVHRQNATLGFAFLCTTIVCLHIVHNATKGVAFQPMIRESTLPNERGWFLAKMRLVVNGFNLIFFATLSITLGAQIEIQDYAWIILVLMIYCAFGGSIIYLFKSPVDENFSSLSGHNFLHEIRESFANSQYRLLMTILILGSLSSLPLFVTYLSLGLQLDVSYISQLMTLNIGGTLIGLFIWGRLIDRLGFMRVLYYILWLLVVMSPLWLFVQPMTLPSWSQLSLMVLGLIAFFTGFLQSGLKMALLVGVHNTVTKEIAVAALAFFNTGGMILNSLLAISVGFYLSYTLDTWTINIDSYQIICLFGALLCFVSAMLCRRKQATLQRV